MRRRLVNASDIAKFQKLEETLHRVNEIELAMNAKRRVEILEPSPHDPFSLKNAEIFIDNRSFLKIVRFR